MGENDNTGARRISFRLRGQCFGDRLQLRIGWKFVGACPRLCFSFVSDDDIAVGDNLRQVGMVLVAESGNEGGRNI